MTSPSSTRRDFLTGQAAADALTQMADSMTPRAAWSSLPANQAYLMQVGRKAMACTFEVFLNAGQYAHATDAALKALDLVDELESQLTVFRETSEIIDINRRAAFEAVPVEARLFALLQFAVALYEETQGAYDITSGPLSKVWGFYRRQGELPEAADLQDSLTRVGSRHLQFSPDNQTIRFDREGMELNLGSIGKGYALDRAAELLSSAGISDCLWHGGQSSILARGSHGGQTTDGWIVSVGDPLRPGKPLAQIRLRNRALGTSGCGTQFFRHAGRRYGHILDPRTGWPVEGMLSATAVAPTAARADALATAFYVMGPVATAEYCRVHPDVAALLAYPRPGQAGLTVCAVGFEEDDLRLDESVAQHVPDLPPSPATGP